MIVFFILGVVCVLGAIELTAYFFLADSLNHPQTPQEREEAIEMLCWVGMGTLILIVGASLYRSWELRSGGGKSVAESMGGRLAKPNGDIKERQLLNIVEEMALASGMPVPPVYVLDNEPGINAFAAGNTPEDAVVAVTSGALYSLKRDELQGVIGHEFSHILNGDMRINIRLMGVIFGIYVIYFIGWMLFRSIFYVSISSSEEEKGAGVAKLGVAGIGLWVMLIGSLGLLFGNLMKAALSRQREYLADASAVQFTRNPKGIADALKRIGGIDPDRQKIRTPAAAEASHLFFSEFSSSLFSLLFATHPPLEKRIRRLDPEFDPDLAVRIERAKAEEGISSRGQASGFAGGADKSPATGVSTSPSSENTDNFARVDTSKYGAPSDLKEKMSKDYAIESHSLADILFAAEGEAEKRQNGGRGLPAPISIRETIGNSLGATAYVLAILTDSQNRKTEEKQKELVSRMLGGILVHDYSRLLKQVASLSPSARLMNLQLAMPALRQLSPRQYAGVREGIRSLIEADFQVDLNEFVIYSMVCRQLDLVFGLKKSAVGTGKMTLAMFRSAVLVLSRLAYAGSSVREEQEKAFRAGLKALNIADADILPKEECSNEKLQKALAMLDKMETAWKREFLLASIQTIMADGKETEREAVLRFGIAAALGIYV